MVSWGTVLWSSWVKLLLPTRIWLWSSDLVVCWTSFEITGPFGMAAFVQRVIFVHIWGHYGDNTNVSWQAICAQNLAQNTFSVNVIYTTVCFFVSLLSFPRAFPWQVCHYFGTIFFPIKYYTSAIHFVNLCFSRASTWNDLLKMGAQPLLKC